MSDFVERYVGQLQRFKIWILVAWVLILALSTWQVCTRHAATHRSSAHTLRRRDPSCSPRAGWPSRRRPVARPLPPMSDGARSIPAHALQGAFSEYFHNVTAQTQLIVLLTQTQGLNITDALLASSFTTDLYLALYNHTEYAALLPANQFGRHVLALAHAPAMTELPRMDG